MSKARKMIIFITTVFIVVVFLFIIAVALILLKDSNKILTYDEVASFEVAEVFKNNRNYLLVSGQYNGSSLKVKSVQEEYTNDDIIVKVYTTLTGENDSSFLYPVELSDNVSRVLFGEDKKIIWQKPSN